MASEFEGSAFTRAMLPSYRAEPDGGRDGVEHTVVLRRGDRIAFEHRGARTVFEFVDASPEVNRKVYFEALFFLQTLFSRLLLENHGVVLAKSAALVQKDSAWLLVG